MTHARHPWLGALVMVVTATWFVVAGIWRLVDGATPEGVFALSVAALIFSSLVVRSRGTVPSSSANADGTVLRTFGGASATTGAAITIVLIGVGVGILYYVFSSHASLVGRALLGVAAFGFLYFAAIGIAHSWRAFRIERGRGR
jgi:hypothetical protein